MSPPEIWGPAVWRLFHTLIEKMNPKAYPYVINSMFNMIVAICKFLPCPECSTDATIFLGKLNLRDYKNKTDFKNMLYLFHNYVNAKKRKPLYNYSNMDKYGTFNLINVINDFISKYNTRGNMKLLSESFHRKIVIKAFVKWFKSNHKAFIQPNNNITSNTPNQNINDSNSDESKSDEVPSNEVEVPSNEVEVPSNEVELQSNEIEVQSNEVEVPSNELYLEDELNNEVQSVN
jgi:hypothetical protein